MNIAITKRKPPLALLLTAEAQSSRLNDINSYARILTAFTSNNINNPLILLAYLTYFLKFAMLTSRTGVIQGSPAYSPKAAHLDVFSWRDVSRS